MATKNTFWVTIINSFDRPEEIRRKDFSLVNFLTGVYSQFGNVITKNLGFLGDVKLADLFLGDAPAAITDLAEVADSATDTTLTFTHSLLADATWYEYDVAGADGVQYYGSELPITITGLTAETAYNIRVRAGNATGASAWCTAVEMTTATGS